MPASSVTALLRDITPRFLEGLAAADAQAIVAAATPRRFPADSVVAHEGYPAEHTYLVVHGRARYFCITPDGRKILLLWIPAGETFGAAAMLLNPANYLLSTETVKNSLVLEWDHATIRRLAVCYPRLMENMLLISFDYLAAYRALHMSLVCDTAGQRVAQVLANLAIGRGHKVPEGIELNVRNEELANAANVTPFTASRLLSAWHRRGVVVKSRGKVLLRSPERLFLQTRVVHGQVATA